MRETLRFEAEQTPGHCSLALGGPGGGNCKDSSCGRRAPVLIAGYCMPCAGKHGINPLTLQPTEPCCTPQQARTR